MNNNIKDEAELIRDEIYLNNKYDLYNDGLILL